MTRRHSQPDSQGSASSLPGPAGPGPPRRGRFLAVLGLLFAGLLLASSGATYLLYRSVRGEMDRLLGERLLAIAGTVAQSVGGEGFTELAVLGPQASEWSRTIEELRRIAQLNELDNLVVLDADYTTIIDVRDELSFGTVHPVFAVQPELRVTMVSSLPQTTPLEPVSISGAADQYLKTGFAPILDLSGIVLGAVAVEGGSGFFTVLSQLRRAAWLSFVLGGVALLILGGLFYRTLRSLIRLEDSMRRAAALAAIGQISAVVAHEIKNPLAILRSRSERVRAKIERGKDPEEILEWFDAIPREVDRLNEIVTNYLSLARPEREGEEHSASVEVIADTVELLRGDLETQGVRVELELDGDPQFRLPLGPRSLKQIVLNLVLNAAQAIESQKRSGRITVGAGRQGKWRELTVTDDGPGMGEQDRRNALQPFYTTKPTGSGLGLSLVSSLVEGRGGRLEIRSEVGDGTRITARFPAG